MLLVFFRAVVTARESQDEGIVALDFAEFAQCVCVIGQLIVRKNGSGYKVRTHDWTPFTSQLSNRSTNLNENSWRANWRAGWSITRSRWYGICSCTRSALTMNRFGAAPM